MELFCIFVRQNNKAMTNKKEVIITKLGRSNVNVIGKNHKVYGITVKSFVNIKQAETARIKLAEQGVKTEIITGAASMYPFYLRVF